MLSVTKGPSDKASVHRDPHIIRLKLAARRMWSKGKFRRTLTHETTKARLLLSENGISFNVKLFLALDRMVETHTWGNCVCVSVTPFGKTFTATTTLLDISYTLQI